MTLDTRRLRQEMQRVYSEVLLDPKKGYHFHTGPEYAAERLGYEPAALAELPDSITAPFAGVGNPLSMGRPEPGSTVLDIGAGSGLDTFLAAKAVGRSGSVIAVDMTDERGRENVALTGLSQVEYRHGMAEALPLLFGEDGRTWEAEFSSILCVGEVGLNGHRSLVDHGQIAQDPAAFPGSAASARATGGSPRGPNRSW
jgi:2-polyprenyl-3-methyl-5-hydroxy-6-metoxy-1,4-benzoquinol methylase